MKYFITEIFDYESFYPLALNRAVFSLILGAMSLKERLEAELEESLEPLSRRWLNDSENKDDILEGYVFDTRFCFYKTIKGNLHKEDVFVDEKGNPVCFYLDGIKREDFYSKDFLTSYLEERPKKNLSSEFFKAKLNHIADFIGYQKEFLENDLQRMLLEKPQKESYEDLSIEGSPDQLWIKDKTNVSKHSVLDVRQGAIIIEKNVSIGAFSYIQGPCYIGEQAVVDQARLKSGCYVGRGCRLGGEVEESIFLDFSNKHHDGFVGHSYIGKFVNLGALSTTSDLKNNYHPITLSYLKNSLKTSYIKLGSFIGDFSKLGIGSLLNTGSMIGLGCNVFVEGGMYPKTVESFSWGVLSSKKYDWDKFLEDTRTIMKRRSEKLTPLEEKILNWVYTKQL